ncbi:MAG: MBOAT family protein [Pseudomonadaceae bacterium]|nr:MBOAT family protein [Pseudomonadaceae bacterium]
MWLAATSLFFYGYWEPKYLFLIGLSIIVNYVLGTRISRVVQTARGDSPHGWILLLIGIVLNVAGLAYFKYSDFFIETLNALSGTQLASLKLLLPLGISFFTFTQIAYLVDCSRSGVRDYNLVNYTLFVTFFPHLIAGPIVHHKDLMPQFASAGNLRFRLDNFSLGLFIFAIGLIKKVLIADNLGQWANAGYSSAQTLTMIEAWSTSLLYSLQLYFDFSGYSDMAIGLGLMFNINLPLNFNSPYQASNIQDFWRRWHITLSTWLRDYVYIPLGGKRAALPRIYFNLFATFLIGGIWHGAGWTFLIWGALHGAAVVLHRYWQDLGMRLPGWLGWAMTFLFVNFAWVFFRAENLPAALHMLSSMLGLSVAGLGHLASNLLPLEALLSLGLAALLAFLAPNSQQIAGLAPYDGRLRFKKGLLAALLVGFAFFYAMVAQIQNAPSDFLYFNF